MTRCYSLSYLTAPDCAPPDLAVVAAELGYSSIGLRVMPAAKNGPYWPLLENARLLSDTRERLRSTGTSVLDIEILWLTPDFDAGAHTALLEVSAALGARSILVGGADPDLERLTDSFSAICAAARPLALAMDLEFMPWTTVPNAAVAARVVSAAGQANGGILVDALHFMRARTPPEDIAALPRSWLHYAQICDGPAEAPATTEGMFLAARYERLLPGEGDIPLRSLFAAMPADMPVSVEVPNAKIIGEIGHRAWARRALEASRRVLEG